MILDKYGPNKNFIIWILLFIIAFGFGKGGECLGFNYFTNTYCDDNRSNKGRKDNCYPPQSISIFGGQANNGFFGGNGLFILIIIALLFLCKDNEKGSIIGDMAECE